MPDEVTYYVSNCNTTHEYGVYPYSPLYSINGEFHLNKKDKTELNDFYIKCEEMDNSDKNANISAVNFISNFMNKNMKILASIFTHDGKEFVENCQITSN